MIQVNSMSFHYSKTQKLFEQLNFNQECGNIVGLFGKNGAGKSSLLKLISGLLNPKEGNLQVNDHFPFKRNPSFLEDLFLITEELYIPSVSIKKYVKAYAPFYKKFDTEKLYRILKEFELNETDQLHKISYGQKKKFLIAFALSTNCKYLLLDEPTNGLDIPSKSIFRKVLVNSLNDSQLVIISTHQVKDIETIIDKIVILEEGKIAFENDIHTISKKLQFTTVSNITDDSEILYHEKTFGGYRTISPIEKDEETEIDIELLFNAVTNNVAINF